MNFFKTGILLLTVLVLVTSFLSCTSDDDDDDSGDDDYTGDDDNDTGDDDSGDDDDNDTGGETLPPLTDLGWMLLCGNEEQAAAHIDAAPDYNVNRIVLSHGLIDDMDEILLDENLADRTARLAAQVKSNGMKTHVWVHELSSFAPGGEICCFDPSDNYWEERRRVYREAIDRVPDLDGVNITMGSGDPPPWFAMCLCPYCLDLPPYGHLLMDLLNSHPDERIRLVMNSVAQGVIDDRGREVVAHGFHHQADEADWMEDALVGDSRTDYRALIKMVNHDWQPYYPMNSLFGNVGLRGQIISFDLGGEYWGQSILPFCEVDHIRMRLRSAIALGVEAANARIERGCNKSMDTPNEVNLYALTRFAENPGLDSATIWDEWLEERYNLTAGSTASQKMKNILASTFDVGRKMYYVEGFWTFTKGSDFPKRARSAEKLIEYSNTKWDLDWQEYFDELNAPTEETVAWVWQEKTEAVRQAESNLLALEGLQTDLSSQDYDNLHARLTHQLYTTRLWRLGADLIFRYQFYKANGSDQQARFLEGSARSLVALADEVEGTLGPDTWPGKPSKVREFLDDFRDVFPDQEEYEDYSQMELTGIGQNEIGSNYAVITWTSSEPATGLVEFGDKLPNYGSFASAGEELTTDHEIRIEGLTPGTYNYYRVHSVNADGTSIVSGDYRFWTKDKD